MNGMAPSRTRGIQRLHTRLGEPCVLPKPPKRVCPECGTVMGWNTDKLCCRCDSKKETEWEKKRRMDAEQYAEIAALHDLGWTWSALGELVGRNPDYLCSQVHKHQREEA